MRIKPVITEKSMKDAKEGKYTFLVGKGFGKLSIKQAVASLFDVEVKKVRTISMKKIVKKTRRGRKRTIPSYKKAIVTLKGDKKIDLFDEKKKGKK